VVPFFFFLRSSFFLVMGLLCISSSSFSDSWISSSDSSFYFLWCVFVDAGGAGSGKVGVQEEAIRTRMPRSTVSSNLLSLSLTHTRTHTNITTDSTTEHLSLTDFIAISSGGQ
jgi:hypothetical protein